MRELIHKETARRIISSPRTKEQMLKILESIPPVEQSEPCEATVENRMNNREKLQQMTDEELANFLCDSNTSCGFCVARKYCYEGHIGFEDWLKAEAEENE